MFSNFVTRARVAVGAAAEQLHLRIDLGGAQAVRPRELAGHATGNVPLRANRRGGYCEDSQR